MRGYQMTSAIGRATGLGGVAALLFTFGCGGTDARLGARGTFVQEPAVQQASAPVVVTCEPTQRTLVRPALVNGAAVSQVECVSTGQGYTSADVVAGPSQAVPVSYRAAAPQPVRLVRDAYEDGPLADTRVVPARTYAPAVRPVRARQVVYDEPRYRRAPVRSVAKSAVIIGASTGAGAGVGAAIGGRKGALIGALLGGGGATVWDQVTRRRP